MTKGNYVDGFVFVVAKKNIAEYKKMAKDGAKVWKKFGALDYKECMGNDLKPRGVKFTFPQMIKPKFNSMHIIKMRLVLKLPFVSSL